MSRDELHGFNRNSLQKLEKIGALFSKKENQERPYHEKFRVENKHLNLHKRSRTAFTENRKILTRKKEQKRSHDDENSERSEFLKRHNSSRLMQKDKRNHTSTNKLRKSDNNIMRYIREEETHKKERELSNCFDKKSNRGSSLTLLNRYPIGSGTERIDTSGLTKAGGECGDNIKRKNKDFLVISGNGNSSVRRKMRSKTIILIH